MIEILGKNLKIQGQLLKIARLDGEKFLFLEEPEPLIERLRKAGSGADLFTFIQKASEPTPKYRYPLEWDNLAALPVSTFAHWWDKQIGFKARNKAKQAEKRGVTLREVPFDGNLIHGIWEIYNETPVRQGKPFSHYGMTLEQIRRYAETFLEQSVFIGAFFEEKMIGFVKLTIDDTRTQAGLMHIVSMVAHRDKAPTNALIASAVRSCAERQIPFLVYSNFAYGKKQSDSLSDFKERNGFQRIDVPRYYVPLTPVGAAAFRLGLHKRLADHVPESVMAKMREFRNAWYSRKSRTSPEAV
ncbi:MAG TPA: hypothetical protein VI386_25125 [Candidatus Sulfotelmatobacter sp.]